MYTYAFFQGADQSVVLPDGIAGPLYRVTTAEVSAVVEPDLDFEAYQHQDDRLIQAVLSHDRVIRDLFRQTALLPLRFGTQFLSKDALISHLHTHQVDYLEKLAYLDGKAEYLIKLVPLEQPEPEIPDEVTGKAYFLAKKQRIQAQVEEQQRRQDELAELKQAIAQYSPGCVQSPPQDAIERIYLLTSHPDELRLLDYVQSLQAQSAYWRLELGEALPPYHFV